MSKVNYVGNNFALSNADVMTALKNSSASMAAANATFEETVALITAGQEIAQDSSKVGNALRTISMRIRGMNEETQELDGSLQTIGGDVYDLTNGKVSIMLDPETYKSPYKILQEISHVWDELTDKQRANLAEALFGKNRANIGIAVIENFKQAEAAMAGMEKSAGAADKEMEIITNSLTYKLNALRETGTGIWQNLFQRDELGGVIDDLTALLSIIEALTDKIGLIGTIVGVGGGATAIFKYLKAFKTLSDVGKSTKFIDVAAEAFAPMKAGVDAYSEALTAGSSKMIAFGVGAKAMIASLMPLIGVLAAIGIAFAGFKAFDYFNTGWTRAQESAQKAVSEFDDAKTKLESLNEEKNDNLSKVQEIAAKYDIQVDGMDDVDDVIEKIKSSDKGITLVDQVELDKLSAANKQLEAQAKVQEQIVEAKKQAAIAETENAAQIEKSYWEEVKERHGKGFLGTIAAGWDYINSRGGGARIDENGKIVDVEAEGERWAQQDTTNIGMARQAYDDLIAKKQELQQLNQEIENSKGGVTDEQIKRHEDLTKEITEQASKAGTLMNTVSSELDVLSQSDSKFAQDYVKQAKQLLLDFSNIDASPAKVALNTINSFFDGSFGKNAIKDELIDAMESGKDLEETLQGLGLSMDDFGNIDKSFLVDYFEDITKSAEEAKDTVDNFHVSIDDVSEATKSANKDADWSTMQSAYKAAGELLKEGKTGTDDFQTVAQFFTDNNLQKLAKEAKDAGGYAADVYQEAFENAQKQADRWFGADETKSMENFVDDMSDKGLFNVDKSDEKGLWDIESQFKTTAEAAKELGTSTEVVETMLSALESYGYDFSGIEKSGEMLSEYQQTLEALKQTYDSMGEGEAKEKFGKMIEEFDTDYGKFKDDLSQLSEDQVIHIKFEYDLASIQSKIDEIQNLIDNGMEDDVQTNAQLMAANNQYIKTAEKGLGMDLEGIQLPVEYVVADNTEANLREQLKDATPEEKVGIQTEIENQQEIKKEILDTFADEHPEIHPNITPDSSEEEINKAVEQVNSALDESFGEKTITFNASLDGVEQELQAHQNEDGTITYTANVDGVQTEVQEVENEDGTITYTAKVEGEEKIEEVASDKKATITANVQVNGAEKVSSATAGANDKNVSVNAKVTGTDNVNNLASAINNAPSSKSIPVTANVSGKGDVDSLASAIRGMPSSKTSYVNVVHTTINKTVNAVDGTAHARGTAFSKGTARKGVSFAGGNWGTKSSGVALVGEEDPEILVRDGRWQLIGENSAEFVAYKKGDIIFNAEQSKQILEKGKISHGKRRGKSFAEGTAFRLGSGGSSGSSSSKKSSSKKKSSGSSKKSSGKKSSSKSKSSSKDNSTTIDWIEIDLKRAEREVKNLKQVADNAFKTFETRTKNLRKEIGATNHEIWLQGKAYEGYVKAANKVGLSEELKRKVREGSIEVSKYDSDTQKKIKEYQDLYEKSLKCKDSINELKESISKLYKQNFENTVKKWENALQTLQYTAERTSDAIERRTKKASDYVNTINKTNASNANIKDYKTLIANANSQLAKRASELKALQNALKEAVAKGGIQVGSEEYYSMLKEIQSAQKEVDKLNSDIIEYTNSIAESYQELFEQVAKNSENLLSRYSHFTNAYNNEIELAEAKGLVSSKKYYEALLRIEKANFDESKKLAQDLQNSLNNAIASGSIKRGSQAWYDMTERINEAKEAIDEAAISLQNYNNKIREIDWERFDTLNEKISDTVDEAEFLIELMSNGKLFNDDGSFSNLGISTVGLHVQNYDVYANQVKRYADEIKSINKLISDDPNNLKLIERRKQLLELQRDSILASQKEKDSIKDLVEDGIKEQISYMDDLIDKYLDALDSQKDLYDYQRKVNDQTSKIASLQKQLTAFSGDTSEEAKQKIQKIQVSLKEAQDNLRDTEYNKYVSDSKKMLNDLKNDFKDTLNARLDDVDALIADVSKTVDGNSQLIMKTLAEQSEAVGYTMTDNITDVWNNEKDVLSSTNSMISKIYDTLVKIWEYADASASQGVQNVSNDNASKNTSERAAEEKSKQKSSATSSASKKATTSVRKPSSTYTGLFNDGKDTYYYVKGKKQTGWKDMNAGKRYFSTKTGKMLTGEQWIGGKTYYFDKSTGVMKKGTFTVGDITYETDKDGILISKVKRNSKNLVGKSNINGVGTLRSSLKGFAIGSHRISKDQVGWTNERGQELLYRKSSGAIMTPLNSGDKVFTNEMADNLWAMSQSGGLESLVKNIIHGNGLSDGYESLRSGLASLGQTNVQQNFDNITFNLPNVTDYNSFIKQMQTDKKFEQFIQSMTIGRINGKPKDMKRHINF